MADSITQSSVFLIFKLNIVDRPAHYQNQKALTQPKALHILQEVRSTGSGKLEINAWI